MQMLDSQKMDHRKLVDQISKLSHEKISVPELITLLDIHYNDMFHVNPWMKKEIKKLAYEFVKNDPNHQLSKHDACDLVEAFINVPLTSLDKQSMSSNTPLHSTSIDDMSTDFSVDSSLLPQPVPFTHSLSRFPSPEKLSDNSFVAAFQKTQSHFAYSDSLIESAFLNIQNCIGSIQNVKKEDISSQLVGIRKESEASLPSFRRRSSSKVISEITESNPSQKDSTPSPITGVWEPFLSFYYIKASIVLLIALVLFSVFYTSSKPNPSKTRPS
ncbi:meiotic spindle pole body protein Dms1 [Schizosaccharomyces osmophilus]|uniref:Meiotic spindle pole body protein Dms1 n=1 Tax=Schizosaccharomyces osmophilus TaxID=2545709 RepID=A0AAE9WG90_9SCHI|nr:meiotic spindle pole body protein Dms1 [Schizosaccharomyces osmophilus]WBW75630.1 meiotic spindle pole body protein Dms1 [Schizosaccharomyces osmophilus]